MEFVRSAAHVGYQSLPETSAKNYKNKHVIFTHERLLSDIKRGIRIMKNYVFYSWQSDLPNNTNRGFLETCILDALKELSVSDLYHIEFSLDKDTKNIAGTPHIAETIFSKIDKSKLFVADVSIINSGMKGRKTPNPNVLIELGYAARVLGWDRIICIYNKAYGSFEDLPFDLKYRRPLCYELSGKDGEDRKNAKKIIIDVIKSNIKSIDSNSLTSINEVGTYLIYEASEFYNQLENNVKIIFLDKRLQKKFGYTDKDFRVEIWDDFDYKFENGEPHEENDIEHHISVIFTDDSYSHNGVDGRECSVFFTLNLKFKQINFSNNKVYCAFEILSRGYSPSRKGRNYSELSDEFMKKTLA